jgi:RNA polymerase sigma factor (sigma-70 family)
VTGHISADLELFCHRVHSGLVGALTLYVGDQGTAEELAQEALLRLSVRWTQVSSFDSPEAWVHRVAINLANSWFRRRAAAQRAAQRVAALPLPRPADSDDAITVRQAVGRLPKQQRAAIVLRYYVDLPAADVAAILLVSPGAVRMLCHRALAALYKSLDLTDIPEDDHAH